MSVSPAFTFAADQLGASSSLNNLEARGTIRIAIKQAGLEAHNITALQMCTVFERIIPKELRARGIEGADLCKRIILGLNHVDDGQSKDSSPDAIFRHLAGEG